MVTLSSFFSSRTRNGGIKLQALLQAFVVDVMKGWPYRQAAPCFLETLLDLVCCPFLHCMLLWCLSYLDSTIQTLNSCFPSRHQETHKPL
jgi:hypothetical protein